MTSVIVDTNVFLDVFTQDALWFDWSNGKLERLTESKAVLIINSIIYAELSIGFSSLVELDNALSVFNLKYEEPDKSALFSAGKAFLKNRSLKGTKSNVLLDFFIGAHADSAGYKILTRDVGRYSLYFPGVSLIHPVLKEASNESLHRTIN